MKKLLAVLCLAAMLLTTFAFATSAANEPQTADLELVITEMNPNAQNNLAQKWYDKFNGGTVLTTNADLYEFVEIANVSDKDIDLKNYALAAHNYEDVYADSSDKFNDNVYVLKDWFATDTIKTFKTFKNGVSSTYSYYASNNIKEIAPKIAAEKGFTEDQPYDVNMPTNSILKPGETAILYILQEQDIAYCQDDTDFRAFYNLPESQLVIPVNKVWNLWNNKNRRYAVVDLRKLSGEIGDASTLSINDPAVISYAEVYTANSCGNIGSGKYGAGNNGSHVELVYHQSYGKDERMGIPARNRAGASVGELTVLQKECFPTLAEIKQAPSLVISGLIANTFARVDRKAEDISSPTFAGATLGYGANAFEAFELTNTSGKDLNLYDYAIFRSAGLYSAESAESQTPALTCRMPFVAGNPVEKTEKNAVFADWMASNGNVNPDTMVLKAGETVLVWSYYSDSYRAGATLTDFRNYYGLTADDKVVIINTNAQEEYGGDPDQKIGGNIANTNSYVYSLAKKTVEGVEGKYALKDMESFVLVNSGMLYFNIDKASRKTVQYGFYKQDLKASFVYGMTNGNAAMGANVDTITLVKWTNASLFTVEGENGVLLLTTATENKLGALTDLQKAGVAAVASMHSSSDDSSGSTKPSNPSTGDSTVAIVLALVAVSAGAVLTMKKKVR